MKCSSQGKYYIIDHQEGSLLEWCTSEYTQIMNYLSSSNSKVLITNTDTFTDTSDCDDLLSQKVKKCNEDLHKEIEQRNQKENFLLYNEGINSLIATEGDSQYLNIKSESKRIPMSRVCLLDLRAEKELSPTDYEIFDVFIFGGILGDNPPKDRTKYLRDVGYQTRHLGPTQMSTDTAVLTSKLIVEQKIPINDIPFIMEPEFYKEKTSDENKNSYEECVCMEGFRFVSNELDPTQGK